MIRILLVDDHALLRQAVGTLLEDQPDLQVVGQAGNAACALELAGRLSPDVALVDIHLGGQPEGLELCREIRKVAPRCRVVALTMDESVTRAAEALAQGAAGYVVKSASLDALVDAIRRVHAGETVLPPSLAAALLGPASPTPGTLAELSRREVEVLRLIAKGLTGPEIARQLGISVKTVQAHRTHIMEKLDIHDRVGLVRYAIREGLIVP